MLGFSCSQPGPRSCSPEADESRAEGSSAASTALSVTDEAGTDSDFQQLSRILLSSEPSNIHRGEFTLSSSVATQPSEHPSCLFVNGMKVMAAWSGTTECPVLGTTYWNPLS